MMRTSPNTNLSIRAAESRDVDTLHAFIGELAEYEHLTHEFVAHADALRRHLFGERRVAEAVIAELDGEPAGFALFFHTFSTFLGRPGLYVEDLYVRRPMRGRGVGRALLARAAAIAVERGCGRLEWSVLDWNEDAIGFYRGIGAAPMDEWTVYRLTGDGLAALAEKGSEPFFREEARTRGGGDE